MFTIVFWLGCAGSQKIIPQTPPTTGATILETIDLSTEFGPEFNGWYYHLTLQESLQGTDIVLPAESGWAAIGTEDRTLLGTGFFPLSSPSEICASGCRLLAVHTSQSNSNQKIPIQADHSLTKQVAPKDSVGITMLDTWTQPLTTLPISTKNLRLRAVTLAPNGNVGQHKHEGRPSFAYILSGDVIEHRGDGDGEHSRGHRVAERSGLVHWWENGESDSTIVVFDIIDAD